MSLSGGILLGYFIKQPNKIPPDKKPTPPHSHSPLQ